MKISGVYLLTSCLLLSTVVTYAGMDAASVSYKGEVLCPPQLVLNDGMYFGIAAGYDTYRIVNDVNFVDVSEGISLNLDPRLSVNGVVGGALLGIGHYFDSFYNTYLGFEIFGNGSGASTDMQLLVNSLSASSLIKYSTDIQVKSNYGLSILPGIKLNKATLFYVRLGYNWTNIDVNEYILNDSAVVSQSPYDVTSSGFNYGLGLETAIKPNVSMRGEYTHTDYSDFTTYLGSGIRPQDNQYMLALIYHFA
jgi:opacity protein-like surface antigen